MTVEPEVVAEMRQVLREIPVDQMNTDDFTALLVVLLRIRRRIDNTGVHPGLRVVR